MRIVYLTIAAYSTIVCALQPSSLQHSRSLRRTTPLLSSVPLGDASRGTSNNVESPLPLNPKGVIFDMDGTLIQHTIDFADMRRRIYEVADSDSIGRDLERTCVLTLAKQLSPEGQIKAQEIFSDIERRALAEMKLMPGGIELLSFLKENGLKHAVITRNMERNVQFMQQLYIDQMKLTDDTLFNPIVARDTVVDTVSLEPLKAKPNPDGIFHVCSVWNCSPSDVIMVGDSANDDIAAANRAGCGGAVLLTQAGGCSLDTDSGYKIGYSEEEIKQRTPSLCVESLNELKMYLQVMLGDQSKCAQSSDLSVTDGVNYLYSPKGYSIEIPSIGVKFV